MLKQIIGILIVVLVIAAIFGGGYFFGAQSIPTAEMEGKEESSGANDGKKDDSATAEETPKDAKTGSLEKPMASLKALDPLKALKKDEKGESTDATEPPGQKKDKETPKNASPSSPEDAAKIAEPKVSPEMAAFIEKVSPIRIGYVIHVAAYLDEIQAQQLANRLQAKGYQAYVLPIWDERKQLWYAVRVGRYNTYAEVSEAISKFALKERLPAKIQGLGSLEFLPPDLLEKDKKEDGKENTKEGAKKDTKEETKEEKKEGDKDKKPPEPQQAASG